MANTVIDYVELRADFRDSQITHVYILVENVSNDGLPVAGWYHKAFPATTSLQSVLEAWAVGSEIPLLWDRGVPPA